MGSLDAQMLSFMFSMHRQLTLDGSITLINAIKVLPKNDGEIIDYGPDEIVAGNVIERTID